MVGDKKKTDLGKNRGYPSLVFPLIEILWQTSPVQDWELTLLSLGNNKKNSKNNPHPNSCAWGFQEHTTIVIKENIQSGISEAVMMTLYLQS
jgi:hypothetical protein